MAPAQGRHAHIEKCNKNNDKANAIYSIILLCIIVIYSFLYVLHLLPLL